MRVNSSVPFFFSKSSTRKEKETISEITLQTSSGYLGSPLIEVEKSKAQVFSFNKEAETKMIQKWKIRRKGGGYKGSCVRAALYMPCLALKCLTKFLRTITIIISGNKLHGCGRPGWGLNPTQQSMRCEVCDGNNIRIWEDNLLPSASGLRPSNGRSTHCNVRKAMNWYSLNASNRTPWLYISFLIPWRQTIQQNY